MGMYTELYISCELKELPNDVENVLNALFGDGNFDELDTLPDHPFFTCPRWSMVGGCSSYYFTPFALSKLHRDHTGTLYLTSRSDLKNYHGEIKGFLDWIMPYIDACEGDHLGHFRYEEEETPTFIFYKG